MRINTQSCPINPVACRKIRSIGCQHFPTLKYRWFIVYVDCRASVFTKVARLLAYMPCERTGPVPVARRDSKRRRWVNSDCPGRRSRCCYVGRRLYHARDLRALKRFAMANPKLRGLMWISAQENTMRSAIIAFTIAVLLAGCTTVAERAVQMEQEAVEMVQVYGPACERIGYTVNTDAWRNCLIELSQAEAVRYSAPVFYGYPTRYPFWPYPY